MFSCHVSMTIATRSGSSIGSGRRTTPRTALKDRRGGADSERQRQHGDSRRNRRPPELPHRVFERPRPGPPGNLPASSSAPPPVESPRTGPRVRPDRRTAWPPAGEPHRREPRKPRARRPPCRHENRSPTPPRRGRPPSTGAASAPVRAAPDGGAAAGLRRGHSSARLGPVAGREDRHNRGDEVLEAGAFPPRRCRRPFAVRL